MTGLKQMAKLTDTLREKIISDFNIGKSQNWLAREYELSPATINKLCKGVEQKNGITKYHNYVEKPFKTKKDGFIYVIYFKDTAGKFFYKIGLASDVRGRVKQHQTSSPFNIYIAISYYCENMSLEEKILHGMFDKERILGEWFELSKKDLIKIKERSLRVTTDGIH